MRRLIISSSASVRLAEARRWLDAPGSRRLIVAANAAAAADVTRSVASRLGGAFGWHHANLAQVALAAAEPILAERRLSPASQTAVDAVAARAVARCARDGGLGRFSAVADRLGFPQALSLTLAEVRMAGVDAAVLPADLAALATAFDAELAATGLADPADVMTLATAHLRAGGSWSWSGAAIALIDLPLRSRLEACFLAAITERGGEVFACAPSADERAIDALCRAMGVMPTVLDDPCTSSLTRLQRGLFSDAVIAPAACDDSVAVMSAPGEERECLEIARRILDAAGAGVRFDRIAVLLRAPVQYRRELDEVFARTGIPAWWSQGTRAPDPAGRAFLALLACRAEEFSARRFAEYLSLGQIPVPNDPDPDRDRIAPRRWEQLLVDASVMGGLDRWRRRLAGLEATLRHAIQMQADDAPGRERDEGRLAHLCALREQALPLLERLAALPERASWREWITHLSALATHALREPERVLDVFADLRLMGPVGPVGLAEVRHVLAPHLRELGAIPSARRYGAVFIGPVDAVRGLEFDVVIVPGLAERLFPRKVAEDPLLLDADRTGLPLDTNADRIAAERLLLHLAVGSATRQFVGSWPRLELDQVRPRVPSWYALEVVRAVEGVVPTFGELSRRADRTGAARIGWPAPSVAEDAIDEVEYDLALLGELLSRPAADTRGAARWLVDGNPHLARSLRARWSRWDAGVHRWDGLFAPSSPAVIDALVGHHPTRHGWSATTLELYAQCPFRMYLHGIQRLAPREDPAPAERLDPMSRGKIIHEVVFRLLVELRDADALPIRVDAVPEVHERVERLLVEVSDRFHDDLNPPIERVWRDEIAWIRADLLDLVASFAVDPTWVPWRFELAFGLPRFARTDADPRLEPIALANGLQLRGAIDLIERGPAGALRVTDFKTGKVRSRAGDVVRGGRTLQPLLYALACEALFPTTAVDGGRLWYVSADAGFEAIHFRLDGAARARVDEVVAAIGHQVAEASLIAAPAERACASCDYRVVCGGSEEARVVRKDPAARRRLDRVRELP